LIMTRKRHSDKKKYNFGAQNFFKKSKKIVTKKKEKEGKKRPGDGGT